MSDQQESEQPNSSTQNALNEEVKPYENKDTGGLLFTLCTGKDKNDQYDEIYFLLGLERRTDHGMFLHFPGGKFDKERDLSSWDAAWREAKEETQVVTKAGIFGLMGFTKNNQKVQSVVGVKTKKGVGFTLYNIQHELSWDIEKFPSKEIPLTKSPKVEKFAMKGYSLQLFPFPQHPISYSVSEEQYNELDLKSLSHLPLIYDYLTHLGKKVRQFPAPGILSALEIQNLRAEVKEDDESKSFSDFHPKSDQAFSFHWVSLRDLNDRFKKVSNQTETSSSSPMKPLYHLSGKPYSYSYSPPRTQSDWNNYYEKYFLLDTLNGDPLVVAKELYYTETESVQLGLEINPPTSNTTKLNEAKLAKVKKSGEKLEEEIKKVERRLRKTKRDNLTDSEKEEIKTILRNQSNIEDTITQIQKIPFDKRNAAIQLVTKEYKKAINNLKTSFEADPQSNTATHAPTANPKVPTEGHAETQESESRSNIETAASVSPPTSPDLNESSLNNAFKAGEGGLFVVKTLSGFEFPISPLVIRCLTCPHGILAQYQSRLKRKSTDNEADTSQSTSPEDNLALSSP